MEQKQQESVNSWRNTILWSLLAAAFVGPGTLTTATKAGSEGGIYYLLPLLMAMVAGYLLMEMAARISLVTRQSLGSVVQQTLGCGVVWLLFIGILLGCVAYEAGNLLGGFAGLSLLFPLGRGWVLLLGILAASLLWSGKVKRIGQAMAVIVLLMGLAFVWTGTHTLLRPSEEMLLAPQAVRAATILALLGTSIVPYNFFLAAGISQEQTMGEMRRGIFLSFCLGGLVTLGILLTGSGLVAFDSFGGLAESLSARLGPSGSFLLALGLLAAGFSSAVTAPLAAAMAGKTLVGAAWSGRQYRLVWGSVLLLGTLVALLDLDIIPLILAAQLANGFLLPFLAALVLYLANSHRWLGDQTNGRWQNIGGGLIFLYLTYQSGNSLSGLLLGTSYPLFSLSLSLLLGGGLLYLARAGARLA